MKTVLYALIFPLVMLSCKSTKISKDAESSKETVMNTNNDAAYSSFFKASGNEPFWNIEMGRDKIIFKSLIPDFEDVAFEYSDPIMAMDANVKTYRLKNNQTTLNITIIQGKCSDSMADKVSPYTVKAEIKRNDALSFQILEGCGAYSTDYRLHDIWSLESLNGDKVTSENFELQKPYIEINSVENTFMGYAGCNNINGSVFSENKVLRFTDVLSTLKMCLPNNQESKFLQLLQSTTTYKIENNRLTLSNASGAEVVFRKVD
ncbi:META domain-containing protein [Flavobacterium sp. TMP13]|uniref:META domain-containing protein n=1 Tax=Flavobacterium sp. TMP13 TaxID=3425950 RepID=UPI003D76E08D